MNIAVIGTGYVGLVTGTCLAETGNVVTCVDIDAEKVEMMRSGKVPIYEPQLDLLFDRNIRQNRLSFTTDTKAAVKDTTVIFLALPTPPGEDGSADLSYVLDVAKQLGSMIDDYKVIVDKSTVPVGTADKVRAAIAEQARVDFDVVSNPEFLKEGYAVDDFMKPERVVIGTSSARAEKIMSELYQPFVRQGNPVIFMDERSAELTKYAANAFLATKISFMNEIARLCEAVGADVDMVRMGIGSDSRIGKRFLFPGIGYGGSCFPKDVAALMKQGEKHGEPIKILQSVTEVNRQQKTLLIDKMKAHYGELSGMKIAMWGLAFKPNTDDIREAPSLYLIDMFSELGVSITAFDPEATDNVRKRIGDKITYNNGSYDTLKDADCLVICTEWSVFRNPDFSKMKCMLKEPVIFDGRNLYDPEQMKDKGFTYYSIGRAAVKQ